MSKQPVSIKDIRHSLAHILAMAALEYDPDIKLGVGPAIENGFYYDILFSRPFSADKLPEIEARMREIIAQDLPFTEVKVTNLDANRIFVNQEFKQELIRDIEERGEALTLYKTGEGFVDLCRGGHVERTGQIPEQAFALTHIAGAYWKGSEKNKMLTRIYGLAFETEEALNVYKVKTEEAKRRDHRVLNESHNYFLISEEIGKGLPIYLPEGAFLRKKLEDLMYQKEFKCGYQYIYSPLLTRKGLYQKSGHLDHYAEDMYSPIEIDGEEYYLKPMNCPHHHQVFKHQRLSYRQLPMRLAEFGTVHRYERSGVLTGLIRARSFTQNDAHIYCQKKDLGVEILNVLQLFKDIFDDIFLIKDYWFRLSLPDFKNGEKFGKIENRDMWDDAIRETRSALDQFNVEYVEGGGEAAFYGPKIDIQIRNVNQKEDTIATIQVDFYSASRFNLEFINKSGKKEQPVIIHRAIMGSFDRFLAFLIEQYDGNFPFWLSFKQVAILSMGENGNLYAAKIVEKLQEQGIRVFFDQSNKSSLGERIQASKKMRVPYVVVVGDKESAESVLSVNSRDNGKLGVLSEEEFFNLLKKEKQY